MQLPDAYRVPEERKMRIRSFPKVLLSAMACLAFFQPLSACSAQVSFSAQVVAPVELTAAQDHQRIMDLLHLTTLRPGASQDLESPYATNYDEAKANPYPNLPDPLVLKNGKRVTTAKAWWTKRRPQIIEAFDSEVYGRVPWKAPRINWEVVRVIHELNGDVPVITKILVGHVDNSAYPQIKVDMELKLSTPANALSPVPIVLEYTFGTFPVRSGAPTRPASAVPIGPTWQQLTLAKGWGYASFIPTSVQPDNGAGLTRGIIGLVNHGQPRKLDDWGALRAWAWGGSRVLDYFETDKNVDAKHVGLAGHSRYGKAALVTMAYDQRFAIAFVSSSGEGGAKLSRRHFGEQLENIAGPGEYHWMAGNFLKYAATLTANDLPVDSHELIALCAPRPAFIGGGATLGTSLIGDSWADVPGSFKGAAAAGPVYRLLGKNDLGTATIPPPETSLIDGDIAFRQHSGGHTPAPNWPSFLAFASHYFREAKLLSTVPSSRTDLPRPDTE